MRMIVGLVAAARSLHTQKIANGLSRLGHRVYVYSLPNHRDTGSGFEPDVVVRYFRREGSIGYLTSHCQLRSWLAYDGVNVLNAHYASGYGTVGSLTRFHPYVLSVWGSDVYDFPQAGKSKRWLLRWNLRNADELMSTSEAMAITTRGLVKDRKITVTPFGVDTNLFRPTEPTGHDSVRIGFVKTISAKYGLEWLLRAFTLLHTNGQSQAISLHVYGDGPLRTEMTELAVSLGVGEKVTFHGRVPHDAVPKILNSLDVVCVPSIRDSESFGVSAVEAMASGIPVVTSDAAGLAEVMEDSITGYVVPRSDASALATGLKTLIDDAELRSQMGRAGRARVIERYDWGQNVRTIELTLLRLASQVKSEKLP